MRRVVITGMGAITPVGLSVEEFWNSVKEGKTNFAEVTRFDSTNYRAHMAAEINNFNPKDYMDFKSAKRMELFSQYAVAAAKEAIEQSGLLNSFFCCCYRILAEKLHTFCRFEIHIILWIKIVDLCCHMRSVICGIKTCYFCKVCFSFFYAVPEFFYTKAYRSDCSHTCNYNSSHFVLLIYTFIPPSTLMTCPVI